MKTWLAALIFLSLSFSSRGAAVVSSAVKTPELFIVDSWVSGFIYGFFSADSTRMKSGWKRANRTAANDLKIWGGLFVSDPNRKFGGRLWEHISRFTYEMPQTASGFVYAQFENTIGGNVDTVRYKNGSCVLTGRHGLFFGNGGPAVTLGNYLIGYEKLHANPHNPIFQHEYGHYLQSRAMGIAYYGRIAIPSIRSEHGNYRKNYTTHDYHPAEQDANRRAFLYFNRHDSTFLDDDYLSSPVTRNRGWDFERNPMQAEGTVVYRKRDTLYYINYRNPSDVENLKKLKVSSKWYDYTFPFLSGFYNAWKYNH